MYVLQKCVFGKNLTVQGAAGLCKGRAKLNRWIVFRWISTVPWSAARFQPTRMIPFFFFSNFDFGWVYWNADRCCNRKGVSLYYLMFVKILLLLLLLTGTRLSLGGSGYFTCLQNMKLVTTKFKSGGLQEKHVVATWNLGNHLSTNHNYDGDDDYDDDDNVGNDTCRIWDLKYMLNQISISDFDAVCIDIYLTKIRRRTLPQSAVWHVGSTNRQAIHRCKSTRPKQIISCVHQRKECRVFILFQIA